jgi:predicted nucleotidyltransferase
MRASPDSFLRRPLSRVLEHPSMVRVLRELLRHGGELSPTMLVERTGLTRPSVLGSLDQFVRQGVVQVLGSQHARLYRVDQGHPLAEPLSKLFEEEDRRFRAVMDALRAVAADAGASAAWLYGSVARGGDAPGSDVDVVVVAPAKIDLVAAKVRDELREREDALRFSASVVGLDYANVVRLAAEDGSWWRTMVADAVPLVGPDPRSLASSLAKGKRRSA